MNPTAFIVVSELENKAVGLARKAAEVTKEFRRKPDTRRTFKRLYISCPDTCCFSALPSMAITAKCTFR